MPGLKSILNCEELGDLKDSASFQYLIQAGYEHIGQVLWNVQGKVESESFDWSNRSCDRLLVTVAMIGWQW